MEFRISSELKNIIGKDLIVNDEVAIFELVKNSYDAHATRVDIVFEKDKIIIRDNGKGMDLDDLKNKWLFVAYSAKKDDTEDEDIINEEQYKDYRNKIKLKRGFAGAKGIGRFSSDRLGQKLRLLAKKVNTNDIHQIEVDWKDFEDNSKKEFIKIKVKYTMFSQHNIEYKNFNNGVILEISNLRTIWNDKKIESLKRSLGKLINPFEINTHSNNFQIYIQRLDSMFDEPVNNELIDVLTMKTTKLVVTIEGNKIISKLTDRGTLIYKIEEENKNKYIKDSSIVLLYLNRKARVNFTKIMGLRTNDFANVMLYNNGFRVYPYGEPGDDSFGIDKRYQQGIRRYLSTRNLIGSININEYSEEFKEKSSRDSGLIATDGFGELYNLFWDKVLKRLEKYVVGVQWSLDEIIRNKDNESENLNILNNIDSKSKIIELISKLVDKDKVNIKKFDTNFLNVIRDKIDPSSLVVLKLSKIALDTNNTELIDEIEKAKKAIEDLQKEKNELEKQVDIGQKSIDGLNKEKKKISSALNSEKEKNIEISKNLERETKQSIFQRSIIGTEKEQILGLQHQIYHSSSRINRNVKLMLKSLDMDSLTSKQKKYMSVISAEADKITSISNFITKANFNLTASDMTVDILIFIKEYIDELYLSNDKVIDSKIKIINIDNINDEFKMKIRPLEITTMIDNFIQNSEKANASKIEFNYSVIDINSIELKIIDNGKGINQKDLEHVFEMGYTTTSGSGIGLYTTKNTIEKLNGNIFVESKNEKGTIFTIRLNK